MIPPLRTLILTALVIAAPTAADAQRPLLPPLSFMGIEVGLPLVDLGREVTTTLRGKSLHCDRSRRDPSVRECRAAIVSPGSDQPLALWASVIDSATGILTLSGPVNGVQLDEWKDRLEADFGVVGAQVQGSQWMMQWVRQGRMIRLTWRMENGSRVASVSLVDGRVLDAWGRKRRYGRGTGPTLPARADSSSTSGRR
jgi:hypothetical protein